MVTIEQLKNINCNNNLKLDLSEMECNNLEYILFKIKGLESLFNLYIKDQEDVNQNTFKLFLEEFSATNYSKHAYINKIAKDILGEEGFNYVKENNILFNVIPERKLIVFFKRC